MQLVFYFRIQDMKTISIALVTVALFIFSCGSGGSSENVAAATAPAVGTTAAYDQSLVKGKVADSVICKNDNSQSYALYLPSNYSSDKQFPCIYFFDAHARGSLPVKAYKDLAEKYGFVLIGSNISKNGTQWQVTNDGVKVLMDDTRMRINIDPKRVYTSGFSGGSRVASTIAILDGGVAGVIGCAAGFPQAGQAFQRKFDYFGLVGDYDFNLTDMAQLDEALAQNGFAHQLLTFNGKHEWPPISDFQMGLLWIQVNGMKENLQPKNDSLISALRKDYDQRIIVAEKSGDIIKEHDLLDGMVRVLGGITDVSPYQKQLTDLITGNNFKNAVVTGTQLQKAEIGEQQELAKQFAAQDEKWWAKKIAELNNVGSGKTQKESQMNKRLINFIGLLGYMNANHALNIGDLKNAATYLKVFKMADPQNSDCSYLTAIYYIKKGSEQEAIASLSEAASLGYCDATQLTSDAAFASLQNNAAFISIVAKVRGNISK